MVQAKQIDETIVVAASSYCLKFYAIDSNLFDMYSECVSHTLDIHWKLLLRRLWPGPTAPRLESARLEETNGCGCQNQWDPILG